MPQTSPLPTYGALYAFGDSLSDAGNVSLASILTGASLPVSPPYYKQSYGPVSASVFSNGPTWVQDLSVTLGLGALNPSLAGGTDFAFGGAETGPTPQNASSPGIQALSLPAQLAAFKASGTPSANALYTVSIGANDVLDILAATGLTAQQQAADLAASVNNEVSFVKQLAASGAKSVLVLNVPDLGKTPTVTATGNPAAVAAASQLSRQYNAMLAGQLSTVGSATIRIVDAYSLIDNAVANPAQYGLANVTAPAWSGTYSSGSSGSLASTDPTAQDQYLFWDHLHPTETGHQALADAAVQQFTGLPALFVVDTTTSQPVAANGQPYNGPVGALHQQYINVTADNLSIAASTPNWFLHSGAGTDALSVSSGTNVLDGGTGSNFLTGGTGTDTFFIDDRQPASDIWSTINNFHAGDAATIFGLTPSDFALSYADGQGAVGSTGLTLHATRPGVPTASLTIAGYTTADLSNGRLSLVYGTTVASAGAPSSPYLYVHANA